MQRHVGCALAVAIACSACDDRPGVTLTLHNADTAALDSVVVLTSGGRYPLGRLAPGAERTVRLQTSSESGIEVEHWRGARRRLVVPGSYFEQHTRATVGVRVRADSVLAVEGLW